MAHLLITSGDAAGTSDQLKDTQLVGGCEANRDIQILDPKVSRRHFTIERLADRFVISELDTKNGVFVNGKRTTQCFCRRGIARRRVSKEFDLEKVIALYVSLIEEMIHSPAEQHGGSAVAAESSTRGVRSIPLRAGRQSGQFHGAL